MFPTSVRQAIEILEACPSSGPVDRPMLVAFARLSAYGHHYPSSMTAEARLLLERWTSIKLAEPSRYLKQRRIALLGIIQELRGSGSD